MIHWICFMQSAIVSDQVINYSLVIFWLLYAVDGNIPQLVNQWSRYILAKKVPKPYKRIKNCSWKSNYCDSPRLDRFFFYVNLLVYQLHMYGKTLMKSLASNNKYNLLYHRIHMYSFIVLIKLRNSRTIKFIVPAIRYIPIEEYFAFSCKILDEKLLKFFCELVLLFFFLAMINADINHKEWLD